MSNQSYTLSIIVEGQDRASGPLGGIGGVLGNIGTIAGGILSANVLQGFAQKILDIGEKAIGSTAQMQAFEIGLSSLVARELKSFDSTMSLNTALDQAAPLAGKLAEKLKDIAIISPYEMGTVQDTFKLGMAFGFTSNESMLFTKGLLNMAAGVGANNDMMGRMAYNLAQVRMQGKVTAVDVRQLAMAGFDLNGALSGMGEQLGVTIDDYQDFNEAIASGKIKWEDFASSFEKYAEEQFGGASERMSRTLMGLKSTFNDFFLLTMPSIFGPATESVTGFLNRILSKFIEFGDSGALEAIGKNIGSFVDNLLTPLNGIMDMVDSGMSFGDIFKTLIPPDVSSVIEGFAGPISEAFAGLNEKLSGEALGNMGTGFDNFAQFFQENGPGIIQVVQDITTAFVDFAAVMIGNVAAWGAEQFDKISNWFAENGPLILEYLAGVANRFKIMVDVIATSWAWIEPLLSGIVDLFMNVTQLLLEISTGDWAAAWETIQQVGVGVWESVSTAAVAFLEWIAGLMGTSLAEIGMVWTNNWNQFALIVQTVVAIIVAKFMELKNNIVAKVLEIKTNIMTGFEAAKLAVITTITSLVTSVAAKLTGMVAKVRELISSFKQAGNDIVQGLKNGMASKIQEVIEWLGKKAAEIANKFKSILRIDSPSKVFAGFGENIMQGLANGIAGSSLAVNAIGNQANAVKSPFSGSSSNSYTYHTPSIQIIVDGARDPDAVADAIFKKLKAQGVTF